MIEKKYRLCAKSCSHYLERAEKAIIKGDFLVICEMAFMSLCNGESCTFGMDKSEARDMCRAELKRLAEISIAIETQEDRDSAQMKKYEKHQKWLASCKCKETGQAWCSVCY